MNKTKEKQNTHRYRQQSSGYQKGRGGLQDKEGQGGQIYRDGRRLDSGRGEHTVKCTDTILQSCTPEIGVTLLTRAASIHLIKI